MNKNMSTTDRVIRIAVVLVIVGLYYFNFISGTLAIILGVVALIFMLTSLVSFCPLYRLIGISTCKI